MRLGIDVDAQDDVHLLWKDFSTGTVEIDYASNLSGTWTLYPDELGSVPQGGALLGGYAVYADANSRLYMIGNGFGTLEYWTNVGGYWTMTYIVGEGEGGVPGAISFPLDMDAAGKLHTAFAHKDTRAHVRHQRIRKLVRGGH